MGIWGNKLVGIYSKPKKYISKLKRIEKSV